jgi:phosphomannomutase
MQIAPGIFKAYDIRGIYPTELNEEGAYAIGRAFVTFLQAREVIVGHDMRLSGPAIFDAVTRGIMDQGADVVNIGLVSTDQYYFACTRLGLPGMMVTASHNPKQYNGFKNGAPDARICSAAPKASRTCGALLRTTPMRQQHAPAVCAPSICRTSS